MGLTVRCESVGATSLTRASTDCKAATPPRSPRTSTLCQLHRAERGSHFASRLQTVCDHRYRRHRGTDRRCLCSQPSAIDVYSIGREALVNAFRHSRASNIEAELEYGVNQLRVLVRDNGCGIDFEVLHSGRDGHWGLSGMRERAERIGARLKVSSSAASGTEVELRVPSSIAFESHGSNRASKWFMRFYPADQKASKPEHVKQVKK